MLHDGRGGRHRLVGRRGGQDEEVDVGRRRRPPCPARPAPDSTASADVVPPTRRSRMPVRSTIHSSVVSSMASRSALVTTLSGSAVPQPVIAAPTSSVDHRAASRRPQPGDRLAGRHPFAVVREARLRSVPRTASAPRASPTVPSTSPGSIGRPASRSATGSNTPAAGLTTTRSVTKRCSPSWRGRGRLAVDPLEQRVEIVGSGDRERRAPVERALGHAGRAPLPGPSSTKVGRCPVVRARGAYWRQRTGLRQLRRQQAGPLVALVVGRASTLATTGMSGVAEVGLGDRLAQAVAGRRHERRVERAADRPASPSGAELLGDRAGGRDAVGIAGDRRPGPERCSWPPTRRLSARRRPPRPCRRRGRARRPSSRCVRRPASAWPRRARRRGGRRRRSRARPRPRGRCTRRGCGRRRQPGSTPRRSTASSTTRLEHERRQLGVAGLRAARRRRRRAAACAMSRSAARTPRRRAPRSRGRPRPAHARLLRSLAGEREGNGHAGGTPGGGGFHVRPTVSSERFQLCLGFVKEAAGHAAAKAASLSAIFRLRRDQHAAIRAQHESSPEAARARSNPVRDGTRPRLRSSPRPGIPTGRGSGLKTRTVRVRIPPGARPSCPRRVDSATQSVARSSQTSPQSTSVSTQPLDSVAWSTMCAASRNGGGAAGSRPS